MQQLQINDHYKILHVQFEAGKNMPRHFASSDAFILVTTGKALLIFNDETVELTPQHPFSIAAKRPHMLKIIDDFEAHIVLANNASIEFLDAQ